MKGSFRIPPGTVIFDENGNGYEVFKDLKDRGVVLKPMEGGLSIVVPHDRIFRKIAYSIILNSKEVKK